MRSVRIENDRLKVDDDSFGVVRDFLEYALSLEALTSTPLAEEIARRFAPGGEGLSLPDVMVAYPALDPDDLPPELRDAWDELRLQEPWVIARSERNAPTRSVALPGVELRQLLDAALATRR